MPRGSRYALSQTSCSACLGGKADIFFTYVIFVGLLLHHALYAVSQKTQNSTDPQEEWEPSEELPTELHPFRSGGWGREGIWAITSQNLSCTRSSQTLEEKFLLEASWQDWLWKTVLNLFIFCLRMQVEACHSNKEMLTDNGNLHSCQGSATEVKDVKAAC